MSEPKRLFLRFAVRLRTHETFSSSLLFHRWFPDGEGDALSLNTGKAFAKLKVWFERSEGSKSGPSKEKLSAETLSRIGVIESGPLRGALDLSGGFSEKEFEAVTGDKKGTEYESIGRKIAAKWIAPPVRDFLNILRVNYGQYWIDDFELWNADYESIASYCTGPLNLHWRIDEDAPWKRFVPGDNEVRLQGVLGSRKEFYTEYLTHEDWGAIGKAAASDYEPPVEAWILARAHRAAETDSLSDAFVIAVTALEIAIDRILREIDFQRSGRENLQERLLKAASLSSDIGKGELRSAVKAIAVRNKIVHSGFEPKANSKPLLYSLIRATASFLSGPGFVFPSAHHGNLEISPDEWEKA
jgi:hypothetical protein